LPVLAAPASGGVPIQRVAKAVVRPLWEAGRGPTPRVMARQPPPPDIAATRVEPVRKTPTVQRQVDNTAEAVQWKAPPAQPAPAAKVDDHHVGNDLDDLARRLLEPVGRMLRAELRHGRERAGHLHDRRR
jgi:hypothetical protein